MKKEKKKENFNVEESMDMNIPAYVDEEIRISLEQIERGEVILFEEVWNQL